MLNLKARRKASFEHLTLNEWTQTVNVAPKADASHPKHFIMPDIEIRTFPCRKDNIGVLLQIGDRVTASIDAPDAGAVLGALEQTGRQLTHILTTHHHGDHTAGNLELKERTGCTIIGPALEASRIPGIDREVADGDIISLGGEDVRVIATPGHTLGHVTYYLPSAHAAFVGDTLFAMGCGRVLEGNHEMMWRSLERLSRLPADTRLYFGHEYTVANARFSLTIEPDNAALDQRLKQAEKIVANGGLTAPTILADELATNVFLRCSEPAIRARLGLGVVPEWRVFAEIRERKNRA